MPLPFNPMSFVTPYTAVGASSIGAGANFANVVNAARNTKVQEGYLANTQKRTELDEKHYGQQEMDKARGQLDAAMLSGNGDMAEAALNNLRAVAGRYGFSIAETRSDAALNTGVTDKVGEQKLLPGSAGKLQPGEVGSEETPFDVDAYDAAQAKVGGAGKLKPGEVGSEQTPFDLDAYDEASQAREQLKAFTGTFRTPGGSLPAEPAGPAEPSIRTPGGSLPPLETAEAKQAPLRGYTLIGQDGKPLYTVAPKDVEMRQRGRVGDVFATLGERTQDAQEKQWIAQAQGIAEKAVGTMPMDEAVKMGMAHFVGMVNDRNKLQMVEANRKPRFGGGGVPSGLMGKNEDKAETVDKYYDNIETALQHAGLPKADQMLGQAEGALRSGDPALQKDALKIILQARSGLTVTEAERRSYRDIDGALTGLEAMLSQWTGSALPEGQVKALLAIVQNMRQANALTKKSIIAHQQRLYKAQNRRKVADDVLNERSDALNPESGAPPEVDPGAGFY